MSTKDFRKNLLENAKKVKGTSTEENLTPGEQYILERKKSREPVTEELTLGQRLLQERLEGKLIEETPIITESVETPVVSEDVRETAQMISEVSEAMPAMPEQRDRLVTPDTEGGRLLEYIDAIKTTTETSQQKSIIEQDLQNTAATMADLANLRSVVTRLQTSLTSLGGGGIGYQEVQNMIGEVDFNVDSADLKEIEIRLEEYVATIVERDLDSSIDAILDSVAASYTTDDIAEGGSNLYYTQARFDSALAQKTTTNLAEGSNLYYTSARFDSAFGQKTTSNLAEGSNLYYTDARADSAVSHGFANKTTTDLAEGSNLYYTQARFDSDFAEKDLHDSALIQGQIDSAINEIEPFDISTKTTSDLAEGSNLYYTQARFDSAFGQKTTSNLTEGSNLYYTDDRVDANFATKTTDDLSQGLTNKYYDSSLFDADFASKNTDDLSEGANNLYYTDARVTSLVDSAYVQDRVTLEAGVHFKGVVNFATDSAPVDPEAGDLYIADSDAVANASWSGIAGELIEAQHGVVWANADSSWHALGSTSVDASVYVQRSGDTMTGTLSLESGNLVVQEGDVTVDNGNITLSEINAKVFTNGIENSNGSEYVKIYKDGNLKAAFKAQEIVSYQPHTYPNNIAANITTTGTDQTLIHKGYVDSSVNTRLALAGGDMTGTISWDEGGNENVGVLQVKDGANSLFSLQASGALKWTSDASTNPSLIYNDQTHIEFSEMTNGTPQTDFASWVYLPNTGIILGADKQTSLTANNLYMRGSDKNIDLQGGAYIYTKRIRPAQDNFGAGLTLEGKVYVGGFLNRNFGIVAEEDQVTVNTPLTMSSNKITNLAAPTSSNDAATKQYVDNGRVGRTGGDSMQGPLNVTAQDPANGRDTNKVQTLGVFSGSDGSALRLGTTRDRVYIGHDNVQMNGPLHVGEIREKNAGDGTVFPNVVEVQDVLKAKNITPGNMGKILVEGWVDGANAAAEILMSNKQYNSSNAYGKLVFRGNSASNSYFQFDKDLDMDNKGLHSVTRLRLKGDKAIQEGTVDRIKFNDKVEIPRVGDSKNGFTIFGRNNTQLLYVYHNPSGTTDAINYTGRQLAGSNNLATVKFVEDAVSSGGAKTWPGRRFKFSAYGQGTGISAGYISPNGTSNTANIYISVECQDGIRINQGAPDFTPGFKQTLTVFEYATDYNAWRQVGFGTFGLQETDYRPNYIVFSGFTWKQRPTFTANTIYSVVVSSMWG